MNPSEKLLLPLFYLAPVSWFSEFLKNNSEITFEQYEHFPKQTYRNRANIYGANGKLSLIIPIHHTGQRTMKDIQISYAENWQKLHWKSIKTAYQSSPYFEFYEDKLQKIYSHQIQNLLEFNLNALQIILSILKVDKAYSFNNEYVKDTALLDFRNQFNAKKDSEYGMEEYYQTFSDGYGFIKDLSILDLICNLGPESLSYIKKIKKLN